LDVYCPNCGERGHHLDYAALCCDSPLCQAPKYDAFAKFPSLMRDLESCNSEADRFDLCNGLVRYNRKDMNLFPFLQSPPRQRNSSSSYSDNRSRQSFPLAPTLSTPHYDAYDPQYSNNGNGYGRHNTYNNVSNFVSNSRIVMQTTTPANHQVESDRDDIDGRYRNRHYRPPLPPVEVEDEVPPPPSLSGKKLRRLEREKEKTLREQERSSKGSNRDIVKYNAVEEDSNRDGDDNGVGRTRFSSSYSSNSSSYSSQRYEADNHSSRKRGREIVMEEQQRIVSSKVSKNGNGGRLVTSVMSPAEAWRQKTQYRQNDH